MSKSRKRGPRLPLLSRVTCPHCWHRFAPEEILWVAAHSDLFGDPLLGEDAQQRFLPSRFDADGNALDVKGVTCRKLACPNCHLVISRALLEMEPLFVSILGAPGSGKSYFLATMTWQLRRLMDPEFGLNFSDADPEANQKLIDYEELLFLNDQANDLVALQKTGLEGGELYEQVNYGNRVVQYPRPFIFPVQPQEAHPGFAHRKRLSRALCLYDNAGEHFLPGGETSNMPIQHLALSRVLLFLFDPTQHPRFRQACAGKSNEPNMKNNLWSHRQDLVLLEAANRIRTYTGLAQHEKFARPLVVVITKYDAWSSLTKGAQLKKEWVVRPGRGLSGLHVGKLKSISKQVRGVLTEHAPELIAAAEGFCKDVIYVPVSAQGTASLLNSKTGFVGIRPKDIKPMWAEVPMLYALHRSVKGLIAEAKSGSNTGGSAKSSGSDAPPDASGPRIYRGTGS